MAESNDSEMRQLLMRARKRIEALEAQVSAREQIAVVGLACRFPGADDATQFWNNLLNGVDGVGPLSDGRWDIEKLVAKGQGPETGHMATADGGFLENIRAFDAPFFGISGREADYMDPQQRLLLETSWHALEDAGIVPARLAGSDTGVFVGISSADYAFRQAGAASAREAWAGTGNALSIAANRLSYVLNLNGPSLAIDTACSSSLVAIHQALRSLRLGECSTAIVAGVNVILNPDTSIAFSQAGMLSPSGRCRTFDETADGYVRSEGVGVIVLRRLKDAERDGDSIRAVIAGSAVNQDGRGNGLTAPNGLAQQAVVRAAQRDAGIAPKDIGYIEAHGTGTPLGDPIEINNLAKVMDSRKGDPVLVGAVKAAIGHTEAAAGIAGVIKTVMALQAGTLPGQLHLSTLNPRLKEAAEQIVTPVRELTTWPEGKDYAGVSAFGFGGTNAHVILKRHKSETVPATREGSDSAILMVSARSEEALKQLAIRLSSSTVTDPCDLAVSLAARRTAHSFRLALPVRRDAPEDVGRELAAWANGAPSRARAGRRMGSRPPRLVFAFSGQGSQRPGMGRGLYQSSATYKTVLHHVGKAFEQSEGADLVSLMFEADEDRLRQTQHAQPAIFALQIALVEELRQHGVIPDAVMGYSLGEYTAACMAGALPVEEMMKLVARRGALFQSLPHGGAMLSVRAPTEWMEGQLAASGGTLDIAARLTSEMSVFAGNSVAIHRLREAAEKEEYSARIVPVSHAFHSHLLDPILPELGSLCTAANLQPLRLPLVSNLDGAIREPGQVLGPEHWVRHSREPVEFFRTIQTLAEDPTTVILEIGPNSTLTALGRATGLFDAERFVSTLSGRGDERLELDDALASLAALGVDIKSETAWKGTVPGSALPLYPFDKTHYWLEAQKAAEPATEATAAVSGLNLPKMPGSDDELIQLFADQLDLVRQTIFSQLAIIEQGGPEDPRGRTVHGEPQKALPPALSAKPAVALATTGADSRSASIVIPKDPAEAPKMRPAAELIWLLAQKSDDASRAYHIPVLLDLSGAINPDHIKAAVATIVKRHEALRAAFPSHGDMQIESADAAEPDFRIIDGRMWSPEDRQAWITTLGEEVFNLEEGQLFRVRLVQTGETSWLLALEAHHLVIDGLSMNILVGELATLYNSLERGAAVVLPEVIPYRAWLADHIANRLSSQSELDQRYWLDRLGNGSPALDLPTDMPRSHDKGWRGGAVLELMQPDEAETVRRAARSLGLTPFMLMHALLALLLGRFAGQTKVAIATPTAGRPADMTGPLIGYCSDLIFSLSTIDPQQSLEDYCKQARTELLSDMSHAGYSFAWIAEDVRNAGGELPLQVVFNYQNAYVSAEFSGATAQILPRPLHYLDGELTLNAVDVDGGLALELNYNSGLFEESTARALLDGYAHLLRAVAAGSRGSLGALPLVSSATRDQLAMLGRGDVRPLPDRPTFKIIEEIAVRDPDLLAIQQGADSITFGALNARANGLAQSLLQSGLTAEQLVAIHLPRSIELVVAQLAIAKAGGAFLVLDRRQPAEWRRRILVQANIALAIGPAEDLSDTAVHFLSPEAGEQLSSPDVVVSKNQLMYVIFTSGSTGEPKGVMIEHGSVANYVSWLGQELDVTPEDRFLQFSAIGFDASIEEIYTALTHGASLVLRDEELPAPAAFWDDLTAKGITILDLPTAYWHELMLDEPALTRMPQSLRHVILGGEAAKPTAVSRWRSHARQSVGLWNTYGPTETTIVCTAARLDGPATSDGAIVPIGTPVANAIACVLDAELEPLPPGAIGGLYIGGPVLARGYLNRPDLTDASFITIPGHDGRFYRTGDLARWRSDGQLEYHGRADDQVKIRGFRIETSEIEKALEQLHGVSSAAVVAHDVDGVKRLAAYVVPATGGEIRSDTLRGSLARSLPNYLVPQAFVSVERLPLNANGKVDRKALPPVDWPAALAGAPEPDAAPLNADEAQIAEIWADVLGIKASALSPDSGFFMVGGDSLLAMRVLTRLNAVAQKSLSPRDLFGITRLGDLARIVSGATNGDSPAAVQKPSRISREQALPLGSSQRRLWFLHKLDPLSGAYNLPSRTELTGPLDPERIRKALAALAARHESLRCRFADDDGQPVAFIDAEATIPFEFVDLSKEPDPNAAVDLAATAMSTAPFKLEGGALARATLFRCAPNKHVLLLCAHHIITDGWSMAILGHDFAKAYSATDDAGPLCGLQPLELGYVDYVAATAEARLSIDEAGLRDFWRGKLGDLPELLELPTDRPRPEAPDGVGKVHRFTLSKVQAQRLRDTARQIGVTPFAVLFSTWGLLLARLSGQPAFAMGTVSANRTLPGSEDIVGFFAETLALRFDLADRPAFAELCRRTQRELVDAMAHSALPFEKLVEDLVTDRSDTHSPIFQTMFVWQNTPTSATQVGDLTLRAERLDKGATQFDLVLDMTEVENGVEAMLEYRTQLFDPATIDRLADRFMHLLDQTVQHPDANVSALGLQDEKGLLQPDIMPDIANRRVDQVLDHWADTCPDATAVIFEVEDGNAQQLTWAEFQTKAHEMAAVMQACGVGPDDTVAICADRSLELLVAIYATMVAGACYAPFDPSAPAERQRTLLTASHAKLLVTQKNLLPLFANDDGSLPALYLTLDEPLPTTGRHVVRSTDASAPIYVIFTSGTTGTPKGVLVPHRGVANMALGMGRMLGVQPGDSLLQFAPLNFDASALQIFVPLLSGGCSVLHHRPDRLGARDFMDVANRHGLTMLDLPAALWRQWVDTMSEEGLRMAPSIRIFLTGGEALSTRTLRRWSALCDRPVTFLSSYGPTEASITATAYVSDSEVLATIEDGAPDIGKPLPNVDVYVLDLFGAPAAQGVIGEIAIGGPGVAIGYLDSPERTAEVFVERPGLGRLYLTGDYGRISADGRFEFHGRRDAQIKIRGFRIEPAEVESAILAYSGISGALVTAQKTTDRRVHLVAYLVPKPGVVALGDGEAEKILIDSLKAHLKEVLPETMVPAAFLLLAEFPILPSGKTNRRALPPVPVAEAQAGPFEPPKPGVETTLADIWREMLKVPAVGRNDNFFELGGDSILSLQLAARARRAGVQFDVRDIFRNQTVADLAAIARVTSSIGDQGPVVGTASLSQASAQRLAKGGLKAESLELLLPSDLPVDQLQAAVEQLVLHHDGLRATFASTPETIVSIEAAIAPGLWQQVEAEDFATAVKNAERDVLDAAPHFRVLFCDGVVRRLVAVAHPLLVDPWSWQLIGEDLAGLASGKVSLPVKTGSVLTLLATNNDPVSDDRETPIRQRSIYPLGPAIVDALTGPALEPWRTTAGEILVAALARAFSRTGKTQTTPADILRRRTSKQSGADFRRTVWGFSVPRPVQIDLSAHSSLRDWLLAAKDGHRLGEDQAARPFGEILFADTTEVKLPTGWTVHALKGTSQTGHAVVLQLDLSAAALVIDYDETTWTESAVVDLAAAMHTDLDQIVALCLTPGAGGLTLSDVPLATVRQEELDRLCAETQEIETLYDASYGQTGMIFHSLLAPTSGAFVIQTRVDFSLALDVAALKAAVGDLVARHPVLRTSFRWQDRAQPLQIVQKQVEINFETIDISDQADEAQALRALSASDLARPLDLLVPPLMRLTLVRRRTGWSLIWLKHHAVIDGWSMPLLYDDLMGFYAARAAGYRVDPTPAPGFDRYIEWLRGWDKKAAQMHWAQELAGFDAATTLAVGRGEAAETGAVGRAIAQLKPADFAALTDLARTERVTLGTVVIGAFLILLARYSGQREVLTNVTVSGRPSDLPEAENIVGMFLNTSPLRAEMDNGQPVWPWLRDLQDRQAANDAMGHLGLIDIQRFSEIPAGQRLSESLIIVQNTPLGAAMSGGLGPGAAGLSQLVTAVEGLQKTGAPITVFAEGRDTELTLSVQYDAGRFDGADMDEMVVRLSQILRKMTADAKIGDLSLLAPQDEARVIAASAGPSVPAPAARSIIAIFEQQARQTPDGIALFDHEQSLTYAELDERASRIARSLIDTGVKTGDVVGLLSQRSLNATAGLLGILKAGAAFLALDPSYPVARLRTMLEDSGARLLLFGSDPDPSITMPALSLDSALAHSAATAEPLPGTFVLTPDSLAYLIYTSGSTGQPKGVRALHRGALNRFNWMWREMPFQDGEVMVQKTALSFVDSVWEIFGPLLAGVPSLVLDDASARDVPRLMDLLAQHKVSRLVLVPTLLRAMLELSPDLGSRLPDLKHWISSGEALPADLVMAFRRAAPDCQMINLYGSSEVAGDVTWYNTAEMADDALLPASLGRPLDNTSIYLLDADRRPVPDGMPGELWIGGANLADGYHGNPDLSAEAFVPNPFGQGLLFRSRDWGRREKDGTITFLGRQDGQVKIRGMRVDLAEVEAAMRDVEPVQSAIALNRPGADGRSRIVGWFAGALSAEDMRTALEARLPRHMVPTSLMALESIPLLPNGKVDRRALPDPNETGSAVAEPVVAPQTDVESALADIWASVLGLAPTAISRNHNYFNLGGDSISAIRVSTRATAAGLPLSVRDVFESQSLAELASRVQPEARQIIGTLPLGRDFPDIAPDHWRRFVLSLESGISEAIAVKAVDSLIEAHPLLGGYVSYPASGPMLVIGSPADADPQVRHQPLFLVEAEIAGPNPVIRLSGHPLLIDAAAWSIILSDLRQCLAGQKIARASLSLNEIAPKISDNPRPVVVAGAKWSIPVDPDLFTSAAKALRTSANELIAAAMMRAYASAGLLGTLAMIRSDRAPGQARSVTGRERIMTLPRSAASPTDDLRAAKHALRSDGSTSAARTADITVRLLGGNAAFDGVVAESPVLMLGLGAKVHLEILAQGSSLSIHLYENSPEATAAIEKMVNAFALTIDDFSKTAELGSDSSVWIASDFPLATIASDALTTLTSRYPDIETVQAVTPGQMGMIFHSFADPDSAVYGLHTTIRLASGFDLSNLERAFSALIERHSILRTHFDWTLGEHPLQVVHETAKIPLTVIDWHALPTETHAVQLAEQITADRAKPIDIAKAPPMRATVVLRPDGGADLLWAVHHAAVDGWSLPILLRDLVVLYDQLLDLPAPRLPAAPNFSAYLAWIAGRDRASAIAHWTAQVGNVTSGTDLVIGGGLAAESGSFASQTFKLTPDSLATLLKKARTEGVTVSTLIQGAWATLLARYNQAEEQVFGVTVSGRPAELAGIEDAVGPYVNVIPLRLTTRDGDQLWDWLRTVQQTHAQNDQHNYLSFADIQNLSGLPAGERLCDSMLVVQNFPMDDGLLEQSPSAGIPTSGTRQGLLSLIRGIKGHQTTSYALTIFAVPKDEGLEIEFVYDEGRFDASQMAGLADHFASVFRYMASASTLRDIDIVEAETEAALVALGRGQHVDFPDVPSVLALFERQVDATPDAPAVIQNAQATTYRQIEAGANVLAAEMMSLGIRKGAIVAVHMDRSPQMIIALMAILKAGAAWLPLDPAYPTDRLTYMLEDSEAALLLHDDLELRFASSVPTLNANEVLASGRTAERPLSALQPEDLAYLIYTSGSTGRPKGVRALHRGLINRLAWGWKTLPYRMPEIAVIKTALPFVDSVSEIFGPLLHGVPAVTMSAQDTADVGRFIEVIEQHGVTWIVLVPSLLRAIVDMTRGQEGRLPSLRTWVVGGEACTAELVAAFRQTFPKARLVNFYGSSEIAGDATWFDTTDMNVEDPSAPVPIGRPVDRNDAFVLDRRLKPVPVMIPGELYVAGDNLADGYHERPELTAEAFLLNPYGTGPMFRTKDWARWNHDAQLEFLGRQDNQVKIRGMRVEIGEVEAVLRSRPGVEDGVVLPFKAPDGGIALVAYWSGEATAEELRSGLGAVLAGYMTPQHWIKLDALPQLPNGKIDRRSLPNPMDSVRQAARGLNARPVGHLEQLLMPAWSAALGMPEEDLPVTEDFFTLGGHSLAAARLLAEATKRTGITLRLKGFYEASSLRDVATHIEAELVSGVSADELEALIEDVKRNQRTEPAT